MMVYTPIVESCHVLLVTASLPVFEVFRIGSDVAVISNPPRNSHSETTSNLTNIMSSHQTILCTIEYQMWNHGASIAIHETNQ
jgi:hypothetical protein